MRQIKHSVKITHENPLGELTLAARFFSSTLEFMVPVEVGGFHLGTMWFQNICVF